MSTDLKPDSIAAISTSSTPASQELVTVASTTDVLSPRQDGEIPKGEPAKPLGSGKKQFELTDQTNLLPARKLIPVFMGLMATILVSILDSSIVSTAIPTISAHFNAGSVAYFIPTINLLTSMVCQPLYGRFSDIFGRKAMLFFCIGTFMVGNIASGFSRNVIELIVFRGVVGVGDGGLNSMVQIIISDLVTLRDRGKYVGYIGVFIAIGQGVGPFIGGVLSEKVSWRWCFWITPPICTAGIVVVLFYLPLKNVEGDMRRKLKAIDVLGALLSLGAGTLLVLPLVWGGVTFSWHSSIVLGTLISSLGALLLFCIWEWKGAKLPLVPMYIFQHVTVCGVYIAMFTTGYVLYSAVYYLPQFFQVGLGYSPIRSGVLLLPVLVSSTVASLFSGIAVSRTGKYRAIVYSGFSTMALGSGLMSTMKVSTPKAAIVVYMLLVGLGAGQTLQTTTVAAQASVSRKDMSVVTAIRNFMRLFGGTLALAAGTTIINNNLRARMNELHIPASTIDGIVNNPTLIHTLLNGTSSEFDVSSDVAKSILDGYEKGIHTVFYVNAALSAFCVVATILMIKHKELIRADEAEMKRKAEEAYKNERKGEKAHGDIEAMVPENDNAMEMTEIGGGDRSSKQPVEAHNA